MLLVLLLSINSVECRIMYKCMYRVGQKEVHRDYRLVRLNDTCQIYDLLHKGSTEGGKTDTSELGARQCENMKENTFCVETCILATSLQEN